MSLCVGIGDLALTLAEDGLDREEIEDAFGVYAQLNVFLRFKGLSEHQEPETLPEIPSRGELDCFPYACLHLLRRAYAYHRAGKSLEPRELEAARDPLLIAEYEKDAPDSHLIDFSDAEGFYVPLDFPHPLWADEECKVLGGVVGSSIRLLQELREVAPLIGISLQDGQLSDSAAAELANHRSNHPFEVERMCWFTFFESATKSIEYKSAIRMG